MKRYKCPYCNEYKEKEDLISHIDRKHHDLLPKDFTATRAVFNTINKKTHGECVICKMETKWNEDTCKYNRLCGSDKCKKKLRSNYKNNMLRVKGTYNILNDPEQQTKMLANRSISGKYKFSDGEEVTYTGSYEKKLLEFLDKVLKVKSSDIIAPGPVLEYAFKGKKLKWITDLLYIPYNLIIEVKDGGSNPNNRNMEEYRDKQIEKERMITDLGTYNYLRLTDNNFYQLLEVFAELKARMLDDNDEEYKALIKINEMASATAGALANHSDAYVVNYGIRNTFMDDTEGYALVNDILSDKILIVDDEGCIKSENTYEYLKNTKVNIYRFLGDREIYKNVLKESISNPNNKTKSYFYEALSGKTMLTPDQIDYDSEFELIDLEKIISKTTSEASTIVQEYKELTGTNIFLPIMKRKEINEAQDVLSGYNYLNILEDINGYFVYNTENGKRSVSYKNIKDIIIEGVL